MAEILTPRPAATVLTIRDSSNGYEILMLRRNIRSEFMGGAYVFPGGGVEVSDASAEQLVVGLDDETASKRLGVESGGLSYYVACLRELFEEAGLLIGCDESGAAVNFTSPEDIRRMADLRRSVNAGDADFFSMLRAEGFRLDLRGVEYVAHWITPVGMPRRYDTRFFVALAPSGQLATHDAGETVADQWVRPREALAAHERGEFDLMFPTIRNLEAIADYSSAGEVLNYARSLESIPCVEPQIRQRDNDVVIVTPGDEGFEVSDA
ncbi:MAG TPA: hypothetical protein VIJ40_06325 [Acidimicrobiales bacterium]